MKVFPCFFSSWVKPWISIIDQRKSRKNAYRKNICIFLIFFRGMLFNVKGRLESCFNRKKCDKNVILVLCQSQVIPSQMILKRTVRCIPYVFQDKKDSKKKNLASDFFCLYHFFPEIEKWYENFWTVSIALKWTI